MKGIRPIIIIGAARSGTTLLGEVLSQHSKLAYRLEPKYIWRFGNPGKKDDVRTTNECTPRIAEYIKGRFRRFVMRNKKERLLEKTPSNCFRVGFINKVYPDAQFIHLIRDGRQVAVSAEKKWTAVPDAPTLKRRFINMEIPVMEWPHYSAAVLRDVFGRLVFPEKGYIWGPHFPGIREFRKHHSIIETCAEQWRQSINYALRQLEGLPGKRVIPVYYEDLCTNPAETIGKILDYLELDHEEVKKYAESRIRLVKRKYSQPETEKMMHIQTMIEEELKLLGYQIK
ncbi:MAG: sulfotransferase [Saprospiraceae bacterium]|nr:sulfotransferase [Saprospiraceae bacterium]